ncbi:trigger factor [Aridibaculum aurantiacum]|uniref:trigger factor n=1 Tax=Aridibaculum aurantiacum TaxID=2810307 RepID=UPI001A97754F|nr:trigger factor [Aridibaculum aurantiacum]
MATVSRENIGLLNDKITVTLSKEDYLPAFEQSLKKYAKTANIPGFRKGMVPTSMVKKMYGSSVFTDEVLRSVEKELNNYMTQEKLDIFAQPLPLDNDARQLDMNNPADYSFAFEVGLKPVIDINPSNISVVRHKVQVTDEMIDAEVERLQTRHGKMTEPEEVNSEDIVLNVTFVETDAEGNEIEGGINKGNSVLVKYFAEAFRSQVMGKKKDDSIQLTLNEAFDEKEREWIQSDLGLKDDATAGDKHFKLNISKVGLVEKAEMTEDFFTAAYPGRNVVNEDDLRKAVREDLQAHFDAQSRNQLHDQIYHALVDHTHIDFPEAFLKRWMEKGGEEPKTAEQAEQEYPSFANSLKWSLISQQLMQQHNVQVEPQEIKDFAKQQIMGYMGVQSLDEAPWLDSYADSMLKDQKFIENTYYQLQTTKIFGILEGQVNVQEDTVTPEQLAAMQHNHAH